MTVKNLEGIRIGITGVGGGVGQSIVRVVKEWPHCTHSVGFDLKPDSVGFFFCDRSFVVPAAIEDRYIESIASHCLSERVDLLIPGSDPELLPLALSKGDLMERGIHVLVSDPDVVRIARNKLETFRFFESLGVPFARTRTISEASALAAETGYPIVVKPIDGSATRNVHVVFSENELAPLLMQEGLIAQEYLLPASWGIPHSQLRLEDTYRDGVIRQEEEISLQFVIGRDREELGVFASRNRLMNGVPMVIEPEMMPEAIDAARPVVRALADQGLVGPCNLQGRVTEHGIVFFELNTRFTGITAMRTQMGFREDEATVRNWLGGESPGALASILKQPDHRVCLRYVTERLVSKTKLEALRGSTRQNDMT